MKIRKGFISNSSSTSFTCEICGNTETGFDCFVDELGFYQCENEHIFCQEEAVGEIEELENDDIGRYVSIKNCPICLFQVISNNDVANYLLKEYNISREIVFEEIKKVNARRKVLKNFEYVKYVFDKQNLDEKKMLEILKDRFHNYSEFRKYIKK